MKEVTIKGRTLQYQTLCDSSEYGEWCWSEFYYGTIKLKRKRFVIFGKVIEEKIPKRIFTINADSQDPRLTKKWWRDQIEHEIKLLERTEELKNNELI